jgi:hypothetical protein
MATSALAQRRNALVRHSASAPAARFGQFATWSAIEDAGHYHSKPGAVTRPIVSRQARPRSRGIKMRHFGRPSHITFKNPDFIKYAESFGAKGYRVERAQDLAPTLKRGLEDKVVAIVDCRVDYSGNMKLTHRLKELRSPL